MSKQEPLNDADKERMSALSAHSAFDVNNTHRIRTSYGTGLAASSTITPGSLILKLHNPNLLLIEKDSLPNVCSFCILERPVLKRCSGCKIPYYCSKTCQNSHWWEIHSRECKLLKKLPDVPPTAVRALIVILLRKEEKDGQEERDWTALESHVGDLKGDVKRWEEIVLQARAGVEFTKAGAGRMEAAMRWLCVLSTNAFRITLPENTPVGLCFSPTLARANHSCTPNAFVVFDSRNVSLRALRSIKKDEQIFISYIDPTEALALRQSTLKQRYFFTCKCARCEGNENAYEHFLRCQKEEDDVDDGARRMDVLCKPQELVKTAERCQVFLKQNPTLTSKSTSTSPTNSSKAFSLLQESPRFSQPSQEQRISHLLLATKPLSSLTANKIFALPPYPEILHETYLAYIDAQAFTPALITLLFLFLHSDVFIYPQLHHPVSVVRLYTIAKLLKHIASLTPTELLQDISGIKTTAASSSASDLSIKEDIAKAMQGIDLINAFHVMVIMVCSEAKKSHGEESAFVKEIEGEIRDVEEVQRLRGPAGETLRKWMGDVGDVGGRKEAERVGGALRGLAGLMARIVGW